MRWETPAPPDGSESIIPERGSRKQDKGSLHCLFRSIAAILLLSLCFCREIQPVPETAAVEECSLIARILQYRAIAFSLRQQLDKIVLWSDHFAEQGNSVSL